MANPFFSIITATLDRPRLLAQALHSAVSQDLNEQAHFEHIVLDGARSDATRSVVRRVAPQSVLIQEVDESLYDAWNHGIERASGQVVVLLNDDDLLPQGALLSAYHAFKRQPALDGLVGQFVITDTKASDLEAARIRGASGSVGSAIRRTPGINAVLLKRSIYEKLSGFSLEYRIASDRHFMIRLLSDRDVSLRRIEELLYVYRAHDASLTMEGSNPDVLAEHAQMAIELSRTFRKRPALRNELLTWHAHVAKNIVTTEAETGDFAAALRHGISAMRHRPFWPCRYAGSRVGIALREFRKS